MNNATFRFLTEINKIREHYGFKPLSQYEFVTPIEWRREYKRVTGSIAAGKCPWC